MKITNSKEKQVMAIIGSRFPLFFALITAIVMLLAAANARADYAILHHFGDSGDGANPWGGLIASGSTLYGMTRDGGIYGQGTLFKMNADGTGYTILHNFGAFSSDGANPYGSLLLSGSTLYGMTAEGGNYGQGTLFKMNTDGTGYTILHNFGAFSSDGANPYGSLLLSGSTLYGMTRSGGSDWGWYGGTGGTLFKINTDGTGYTILHNFTSSPNASQPHGSLVLDGYTLYGMTAYAGYMWGGTLFKINTDGTGHTLLYQFGTGQQGAHPFGSPILSNSTLYGMTAAYGGGNEAGVLFKINTDGTGYTILHNFGAFTDDGYHPFGSPILSGSTLYGMTRDGGIYGTVEWGDVQYWGGVLFKMNTDGTGYTILHNFGGGGDGANPYYSSPVLSGSALYGMTTSGGNYGGGVLFRYTLSESVPSTPAEVINIIDNMLASGEITSAAIANSIVSQLSNAQENLATNPTSAENMLNAVINFIEAQSGKKITTQSAEALIKYLTGIIAGL